jgi:hypothetical protein
MLFNVIDGLSDGLDLFRFLVGDRKFEFVFEFHHEFYGVEGVGVQIIDEMGFASDLAFIHAHLFADDLDDFLLDIFYCHLCTYPDAVISDSMKETDGPKQKFVFLAIRRPEDASGAARRPMTFWGRADYSGAQSVCK